MKARNEKNAVIKKITLTTLTEDLDKEIINYNEFLNSFTLDEDYYINKRKKIKKYFALLTPITCAIIIMQILTVYVFIPLGKYNYAMSLIEDGYYFKANTYLEGNKWGDSDKQIQLNTARFFFHEGNYESGIDFLYNFGVEIDVSYDIEDGQGKTFETIKKFKYINNIPTKKGYYFYGWVIDSYFIADSKLNYKTSLKLKPLWIAL